MTAQVNLYYFLGNVKYRRKSQESGAELVDVREGDVMVKSMWKAEIQRGGGEGDGRKRMVDLEFKWQ